MKLCEKIQFLVSERGLSQTEIAHAIGMPVQRVNEWANDRGKPNIKQALKLARTLRVPLEYLADDEMEQPPAWVPPDSERKVMDVIHEIGFDEAYRRLVCKPDAGMPGGVVIEGRPIKASKPGKKQERA